MTDSRIEIKNKQITLFIPDGKSKVINHNSKLSNDLLQLVYERRHQGMTLPQLKDWLLEEHKVDICISSLSRRLKKVNQLNQAVAQAIYIQSAVQGAEDMTKLLDKSIVQLDATYDSLTAQALFSEARQYKDTLLRFMAQKIKLVEMGNNKKEEENQDSVEIEELLSRMSAQTLPAGTIDLRLEDEDKGTK